MSTLKNLFSGWEIVDEKKDDKKRETTYATRVKAGFMYRVSVVYLDGRGAIKACTESMTFVPNR